MAHSSGHKQLEASGEEKGNYPGGQMEAFDKDELARSSNQRDANKTCFAFLVRSKFCS